MFMLAAGGAMAGLSAFQSYQASKAKAAAEMTQYNDNMMKQSMQSGVQLFNNASANVNRMIANDNIADSALNALVNSETAMQTTYEYNMSNMAKMMEQQTQSLRRGAANKLGRNSGTYKLAIDKMKEAGNESYVQGLRNKAKQEKAQQIQYSNNLNQRDLMSSNQTAALIPGLPPVEANHTAAAIQGGMQGFQQGMGMAGDLSKAFPNQKWMQP